MPNDKFHNGSYGKDKTTEKFLSNGTITQDDLDLINKFIAKKCAVKAKLSDGRIRELVVCLCHWRRWLKVEYRRLTIDDVYLALTNFKNEKTIKGTSYSENTRHDYIAILKQFIRWLVNEKIVIIPDSEIKLKEIEIPKVNKNTTRPEDLITTDEIFQLLNSIMNIKHRALFAVLYESMCRPEEIAALTWKSVTKDKYGYQLDIYSPKTNTYRYVRLKNSSPYLSEWEKMTKKDGYVFPGRYGMMTWAGMRSILQRATKNAGLSNRIKKLYLFRKSRITQMVSDGVNEAAIREMAWGNQSTLMMSTYVKLSRTRIDQMLGINPDEKREDVLTVLTCSYCLELNESTAKFCKICGRPLTIDAIDNTRAAEQYIRSLPEYRELLERLSREQ
jgi:integrase